MNKLKINFLGTGIELKKILVPEDVLEQWKEIVKSKKTITEALLDPFFYYKLKDKKYTGLEDLPSEKCTGILNLPKSQVEFWFNRKKLYKLKTNELSNENVLFPLFNIEKKDLNFTNQKGIYILQNEIGTIGTYELEVDSNRLTIEDFTFEVNSFENKTFIEKIKYQNQDLTFVKKDTIITYQTGFEVF